MRRDLDIEGDGVCTAFFDCLWRNAKGENEDIPIYIPDTVIVESGRLLHWYFTGVQGTILRKKFANTTSDEIEKVFIKKTSADSQIVAYFIETSPKGGQHDAHFQIKYMSKSDLHDFLNQLKEKQSGILQRFIQPKGTRNDMLSAIWTPALCLLERRVNKCQLEDNQISLSARAATFDAPETYCSSVPIQGCALARAVQNLCEKVVARIKETTRGRQVISRMMVSLKVDSRNRLFLLWTSSIRLDTENSDSLSSYQSFRPIGLRYAVKINPEEKIEITSKPMRAAKTLNRCDFLDEDPDACPSCGILRSVSGFKKYHSVPFRTIILHFEKIIEVMMNQEAFERNEQVMWPPKETILQAAGNVGFGTLSSNYSDARMVKVSELVIPPVLKKMQPRLGIKGYKRYRNDPVFLSKHCKVCETCFLSYTKLSCNSFNITMSVVLD